MKNKGWCEHNYFFLTSKSVTSSTFFMSRLVTVSYCICDLLHLLQRKEKNCPNSVHFCSCYSLCFLSSSDLQKNFLILDGCQRRRRGTELKTNLCLMTQWHNVTQCLMPRQDFPCSVFCGSTKRARFFPQMYWKLIQLVLLAALKETTAQVDPVIINDYPGHSECVYLA